MQYLPSPAAKEILDSISSMSPCIVVKDDGVRCQHVSSLSPECWTKKITQEIAVVGSVYCLLLRYMILRFIGVDFVSQVTGPKCE
jgi:hypothetical protein